MAFTAVSAVAVGYAGATYAGVDDWLLDRGYEVSLRLDESGGLFDSAEVTYRGVTVGEVSELQPTRSGVVAVLDLEDGSKIPARARAEVHNRSAVGEQYVDLLPTGGDGPYLQHGDVIPTTRTSTPLQEEELLVSLDRFTVSVGRNNLRTVVDEMGTAFHGTGPQLQRLIDNSQSLTRAASANLKPTVRLLNDSRVVLRTQRQQTSHIQSFTHDLAGLSADIRRADPDLRATIDRGSGAAQEIRRLVEQIEPRSGELLGNLQTLNAITAARLPGIEQFLVAYPVAAAAAFTAIPGDGWAHFAVTATPDSAVCTDGYIPIDRWRTPSDTTRAPVYKKAHCAEPPPTNMRGSRYAPPPRNSR